MEDEVHKSKVAKAVQEADPEFLKILYQTKVQQFLSDNGRIWVTGSFLIPLSLVPFSGVIGHSLSRWELLLLAGGSVLLISSWLLIAEAHRNFQNASLNWMIGIEKKFDLAPKGRMEKASEDKFLSRLMDKPGAVRRFRYVLWLVIVASWIALIAAAPQFG